MPLSLRFGMKKLVFLIPLFVLVFFLIPDVDAGMTIENQKTFSKDLTVTVKSDGRVAITGQINACGNALQWSIYIVGQEVFYDWTAVEKIKCYGKEWLFHHVYLEVWEGKADNNGDTHEMYWSPHLEPIRESKDKSRYLDPFDKLGIHAAFIYTDHENHHDKDHDG